MKVFLLWLAVTAVGFVIAAGGYHAYLTGNPRSVLVAVDASNPMAGAMSSAMAELRELGNRPYTRFALFSDRGKVHGWAEQLTTKRIETYGRRNFTKLFAGDLGREFSEADTIFLITTAGDDTLKGLPASWQVRTPG